jgi:cytosine/adenosine deaminase-related metal-dependent hydrolase
MYPLALSARWVVPVAAPPIKYGMVTITSGGRIARVGSGTDVSGRKIELGNAVIMPGFVNAHMHLELSVCSGALSPPDDFVSWLGNMVSICKRLRTLNVDRALDTAIRDMTASGITAVGDISRSGISARFLQRSGLRAVIYRETINPFPLLSDISAWILKRGLRRDEVDNCRVVYGVSPHAPYSVSAKLYMRCAAIARELRLPICSHIAESREEIRYLEGGDGRMKQFFKKRYPYFLLQKPPGCSPVLYMEKLGLLDRDFSLIHCHYLKKEEIKLVANSGSSIVYCPKSHCFFGHPRYPLEHYLRERINIALGTDSLASNDTLSILEEMKSVAQSHPRVTAESIVQMATINGAKALGLQDVTGSLKPGMRADICVVSLPPSAEHWEDCIRIPGSRNLMTIVDGEILFQEEGINGSSQK